MPVMYSAVRRFDPACGDSWRDFLNWSGLSQIREVVSLNSILCPTICEELTDEDWKHNVQEDHKLHLFQDLEYLLDRVGRSGRVNILALMQNPPDDELRSFDDSRFAFRGFDLMDLQLGNCALVNCGGFPNPFSPDDLSECGLLTDHAKALLVQRLLRAEYSDCFDANSDVWAIWQMKSGPEPPSPHWR